MKDNTKEDMKELYRQAADIASVVPESMQAEAFNRALERLEVSQKQTYSSPKDKQIAQKNHIDSQTVSLDRSIAGWYNDFNVAATQGISSGNKVLDNALRVLSDARRLHNIEKLSPLEIETILKEKFRIFANSKQISDKLGKEVGNLVDRKKIGRGYEYIILQDGEEYLMDNKENSIPKRAGKKRQKKNPLKKVMITSSTRNSGRPPQKALLMNLISNGFFDQPKKISDVIEHIKKTKAYTYKISDLTAPITRLMRDDLLKRDEDQNGQWEYRKI